ncbi:hypothetical protein RYX36_017834, partial [Vicia faba]
GFRIPRSPPHEGSRLRRRLRRKEASPQHRQGSMDRRNQFSHPRCPSHRCHGS